MSLQLNNIEDINKLSTEQLQSPEVVSAIEELASDPSLEFESGNARNFYDTLEKSVLSARGLAGDKALLARYNVVLAKLFYWALPALSANQKKKAFSENLLVTLKNGVYPVEILKRYLDLFEDEAEPDMEKRNGFLQSLSSNQEWIGEESIQLKTGESVSPNIQNWIKNYLSFQPEKALQGSFDKINFLTKNENATKLNKDDKEMLSEVIDIYRFLKNPGESVFSKDRFESQVNIPAPVRPATPPSLKPAAHPENEMTTFEKRLAQVSAPIGQHGVDLEVLKHRLESPVLKPNLNNPINTEIKREVKTPEINPPKPNFNNPVNSEIRREVETRELPRHIEPKPEPKPAPYVPKPAPIPAPTPKPVVPTAPRPVIQTPPVAAMSLISLDKINTIDDLKKIEPGHLRQASIIIQSTLIQSKVMSLAKSAHVMPYYAVLAFEQSPLFKIYLQIGSLMMDDVGVDRVTAFKDASRKLNNNLTLDEFEAVADLRKSLEQL